MDFIEKDITSEEWREYEYSDGFVYRIESPKILYLKEGATGHRILDIYGVVHWVPINKIHVLRWRAASNADPVSF